MASRPRTRKNMKMKDFIGMFRNEISNYKKSSSNNLEFEVRFGNKSVRITQPIFENIYRDLSSKGFDVIESKYSLKTQLDYPRESKLSNIRVEVNDLQNIQFICKNNKLPDLEKVQFMLKRQYGNQIKFPYYVDEYAYRVSIQEEMNLNYYKDSDVKQIIDDWSSPNMKKTFRYIHRTSMKHNAFANLRVDLSVVKHNYKNKQSKFTDARVLDSKPYFEVEIELVDINSSTDFPKVLNDISKVIKYILCSIQESPFPVSFMELDNVFNEYFDIINDDTMPRIKKSFNFIGPSSQTLHKTNIVKDEFIKSVCIQDDFGVTDKADGTRKMLIIDTNGKIYFMDQNMNVQFTGVTCDDKHIYGTIIDGEHIVQDKFGRKINYYAAFDIYFIRKRDYRSSKFYMPKQQETQGQKSVKKEETRHYYLGLVIQRLQKSLKYSSSNYPLKIERKKFLFSNNIPGQEISIFKCCETLLSQIKRNDYIYNTDGLIFTSQLLGVGQEYDGDEIKNKKYSWGHSFKWKPPQYNTIDFLIKVKRDKKNELNVKTKLIDAEIQQFYEIDLMVGFDDKKHGNRQLAMLNLDHEKKDFNKNSKTYHAEKF